MTHRNRNRAVGLTLLLACPLWAPAAEPVIREPHPRLLIDPDGVAALQARCGAARSHGELPPDLDPADLLAQQSALGRLEQSALVILQRRAGPDDLFVPAMMHLITGSPGQPDVYTEYVTTELLDTTRGPHGLDAVVALDWCWDAIEPDVRWRVADLLSESMDPLEPSDSPFDHRTFSHKLCSLAAALALHDSATSREPERSARVARTLSMGEAYLKGPMLELCRQRGAVPTSGANGIHEEADMTLAVDLWQSATGEPLWSLFAASLGRAMEHYFYADTGDDRLDHGFIHDDGSEIPRQPGQVYEGFVPAVPWAIARGTGDPIATWYTRHLPTHEGKGWQPQVDRYAWVPLLYGPPNRGEADRGACPHARDFGGGWVAMRSGWAGGETVLLFDAGQPFWRSRQHFDAGQFQIYRKGRLAIDSGDDVTYEAVRHKGGKTQIGAVPGDWDQYAQATIAHNCVTVTDRLQRMKLYDRPWLAQGNQRLIESSYDPAVGDVAEAGRFTGALTAFETNAYYSWAAADLTAAWPAKVVQSMHRGILFLRAGAVVVVDRVAARRAHSEKTWHLQMAARPRIDGRPLEECRQIHGVDARAGIWEMQPDEAWMDVIHMGGRLFVRTLLPADAARRIAGGPMESRRIEAGAMAGRTYFGGDPVGYEHRLWSASSLQAPNAAYELGKPTGLGPQFGVGATWGRLDVIAPPKTEDATFLHVLVPADRTVEAPPEMAFELQEDIGVLDLALPEQSVQVALVLAAPFAGHVTVREPGTQKVLLDQPLAMQVEPNAPIPRVAPPDR